jgi:hypothetical protein
MNAELDVFGSLLLIVWMGAGASAVYTFYRQKHAAWWHWMLLLVGVAMLAIGLLNIFVYVRLGL